MKTRYWLHKTWVLVGSLALIAGLGGLVPARTARADSSLSVVVSGATAAGAVTSPHAQSITLTVLGITASDKTYDGAATATLDVSGATLEGVDTDTCPNVYLDTSGASGTFVDGLGAPTANAGTWTVMVGGLALGGTDAGCYAFDPTTTTTAAINATPLTITANDATKVYGDPLPIFSVTYDGFVNGETESVLGGTLAFNTSATAASPVNDYEVTPYDLTSTNYDLIFASGMLFIIEADTTTTLASSSNPAAFGAAVTFTATVTSSSGAVTASAVEFQDATVTIDGCDSQGLDGSGQATCTLSTLVAGPHAIRAQYLNDGNYNPSLSSTLNQVVDNCASTVTVVNNSDSDAGSLRQAIADVCPGGVINFDYDYAITLTSGQLTVDRDLTIDGTGHNVTISGDGNVRVFNILAGLGVQLSQLTITQGHSTGSEGGGIYNEGNLTLSDSTLSYNSGGGDFGGGGIYNAGNLTVLHSRIISNTSTNRGGGIYNSGTLTVQSSTLAGNAAAAGGGGLYNHGGTATLQTSTFSNNMTTAASYSEGYGGGGINNTGVLSVDNCTFAANSAPFNAGGAIYNDSPGTTLHVTASTLSGNWSDYGDGISNNSGTLSLNKTIIANSPSGYDCLLGVPGVAWEYSVDSLFEATGSSACGDHGDYHTLVGTDPLLGPLGDYGGATQTFALLPGSPAIDFVKLTGCTPADQRGQPRNDLACDIGAFELKYPDSPTVIRPVSSTSLTTFGPALMGVQRDAGFTDPGVITVTKSAWKTKGSESIGATWAITPTTPSGFNLTLTLCYTDAELGSLSESALHFWRYSGGTWTMNANDPALSTINGNHCATVSGIQELSTWTLAISQPTAVTLRGYAARSDGLPPLIPALIVVALCGAGVLGARARRSRLPR